MPKDIFSKQEILKHKYEIISAVTPFFVHSVLLLWGAFIATKFSDFNLVTVWNRWDAIHYINIAQYGYNPSHLNIETIQFMSRFPPLYPVFLRGFSIIFFNSYVFGSLLLSTLFTSAMSVYLYKLTLHETKNKSNALWSVVFLNIFPTSYFLLAPYSESLFLLLAIMYFYYARVKNGYFLPSILYSLSLITRVFGVFMYPVHLYFYIQKLKSSSNSVKSIINDTFFLTLPGITFLAYQLWLMLEKSGEGYLNSKDASSIKIGVPFFELYSSLSKIIVNPFILIDQSFMYTIGFTVVFMFFVIVLFFIGLSRLNLSYSIYVFCFILFVSCLRWVISGPRFVLICFPLYILLSQVTKTWQKIFLSLIFLTFLFVFSYRYLIGWWAF